MDGQITSAQLSVLEQMQHQHLKHALQGLLPPTVNAHGLRHVLDLNSYGGHWALDLALIYPDLTVTGLHSDPEAVTVARQNAIVANLDRVYFYEADLHQPLSLSNRSFDFVHVFLPYTLFRPLEWPVILQECKRVMQPGASINLVGFTQGPSSSEAYQRVLYLGDKFKERAGFRFEREKVATSTGIHLYGLLLQAGFEQASYDLRPVDLGNWNNATGRACCQRLLYEVQRARGVFQKYGIIEEAEFKSLLLQAYQDTQELDFCATGVLISAVATKK